MPGRQTRYYFGRLNLMAAGEERPRLLSAGMQSHTALSRRGQRWQFLQVRLIGDPSAGSFYTGYLGKYKPSAEEEVAIPEAQDIDDQTIENRITAKARFFLHTESHLIAFHPVGSLITRGAFCARFRDVFRLAFANFFIEAEIQLLEEEREMLEALSSFTNIASVHIYLHPSNPRNRDIWRRTDERLRTLGVSEYREHYQGASLNVADDEDITAKIAMAADGYGSAEVRGSSDGEERTVSTGDNPISASVPSTLERPEEILGGLLAKFSRLVDRFNRQ